MRDVVRKLERFGNGKSWRSSWTREELGGERKREKGGKVESEWAGGKCKVLVIFSMEMINCDVCQSG